MCCARTTLSRQFGQIFPDLVIDTFAPLGDGWGNRTFLINDAVVFRFPKDADAATALIRERRLLPELAPALPLPIPRYHYAGHPTAQYPFVFGGYPLLGGTLLSDCAPEVQDATWW